MDSLSQWEKVLYDEWFIYMRIYENTELIKLGGDVTTRIEIEKREKHFPLLVSFESNSSLGYREGMYALQNNCGYLQMRDIDTPIVTAEDEKNMTDTLQLIFQIGKQKGHEVLFLAFDPSVTSEKYWIVFRTLLRINNGIFKCIYV